MLQIAESKGKFHHFDEEGFGRGAYESFEEACQALKEKSRKTGRKIKETESGPILLD